MTSAVHFQPVSQAEGSVTITVPISRSSNSCLTWRKITIGAIGIGIAAATATAAYFLSVSNPFAETEPPMSESMRSLHDIARLVTTGSDHYRNCVPAFQAHWEHFKECGASADECMRNSIKLFGKLFCKQPNSLGYIDDSSEKCANTYFTLQRCDP